MVRLLALFMQYLENCYLLLLLGKCQDKSLAQGKENLSPQILFLIYLCLCVEITLTFQTWAICYIYFPLSL
ncbi:MAG: hypothetical protein ACRC7H_07290, partial [Plesiomonas shigelloides]